MDEFKEITEESKNKLKEMKKDKFYQEIKSTVTDGIKIAI